MLCERCRIREANIQYTEVINGVKTEHHLCAQCAKEMDFGPYAAIFDGDFPLGKLLSGLLGIESTTQVPDKMRQITCPSCQTSYEEFVRNSCFGCADCYSVFGPLMEESLKQLQGSVSHTGKRPKYQEIACMPGQERKNKETAAGGEKNQEGTALPDGAQSDRDAALNGAGTEATCKEEIMEWEAKLKEALRLEDYETAAVCRDKMKALKKGHEANA